MIEEVRWGIWCCPCLNSACGGTRTILETPYRQLVLVGVVSDAISGLDASSDNTLGVCLFVGSIDALWLLISYTNDCILALLWLWTLCSLEASYWFKRFVSFITHIESPMITNMQMNENNTKIVLACKEPVVTEGWQSLLCWKKDDNYT